METNPFKTIQSEIQEVKNLITCIINQKKKEELDKFYTIEEAAKLLKYSKQSINIKIKKGIIKAYELSPGEKKLIPYSEIYNSLHEVKSIRYKR